MDAAAVTVDGNMYNSLKSGHRNALMALSDLVDNFVVRAATTLLLLLQLRPSLISPLLLLTSLPGRPRAAPGHRSLDPQTRLRQSDESLRRRRRDRRGVRRRQVFTRHRRVEQDDRDRAGRADRAVRDGRQERVRVHVPDGRGHWGARLADVQVRGRRCCRAGANAATTTWSLACAPSPRRHPPPSAAWRCSPKQ